MRVSFHLCFNGQCEAAFRFYHEVLGGRTVTMLKYGESPLAGQTPPHLRDRIAHATLALESFELLGADVMPGDYQPPAGFFVVLNFSDPADASRVFNALGVGGEIQVPFGKTFWSEGFGVLVDRFGAPWEINS